MVVIPLTGWRFKTDDIFRESVPIDGCNPDRISDNPEISFIVNPETEPLKVALLHVKLPDASTEKVFLLFFKVPVYWGELILSLVPICNNKDAAHVCSEFDRSFNA